MVNVGPPLVAFTIVVQKRTDDDVGVPVTVDVTRRRDGASEPGVDLVALGGPVGGGAETGFRSVVDLGPPLV